MRSPRRTRSAAAPFGPPNLWAVTEHRSASERAEVDGDVTGGRARVDVDQRARGTRRADDLGDGRLHRSDLVVRELDADERGAGPDAAATAVASTRRVRGRRRPR